MLFQLRKLFYLLLKTKLKLKFFPFGFDKLGIWFYYDGDEICLRWFWRFKAKRWLSVSANGEFNSIKEIKEYWRGFEEAISKARISI